MFAARYLKKKGYRVLAKNWRARGVEVDVVVEDPRGEVVFVEVKTRRSTHMGYPEEAVTAEKRRHMERAAEAWIAEHRVLGPWRADVVAITMREGADPEIVHFEGV